MLPVALRANATKRAGIVARPERFELPTPRFVVWCSIQLSYGRVAQCAEGSAQGAEMSFPIKGKAAHSYRLAATLARDGARRRLRRSAGR